MPMKINVSEDEVKKQVINTIENEGVLNPKYDINKDGIIDTILPTSDININGKTVYNIKDIKTLGGYQLFPPISTDSLLTGHMINYSAIVTFHKEIYKVEAFNPTTNSWEDLTSNFGGKTFCDMIVLNYYPYSKYRIWYNKTTFNGKDDDALDKIKDLYFVCNQFYIDDTGLPTANGITPLKNVWFRSYYSTDETFSDVTLMKEYNISLYYSLFTKITEMFDENTNYSKKLVSLEIDLSQATTPSGELFLNYNKPFIQFCCGFTTVRGDRNRIENLLAYIRDFKAKDRVHHRCIIDYLTAGNMLKLPVGDPPYLEEGMVRWNSTTKTIEVYDGTSWKSVTLN